MSRVGHMAGEDRGRGYHVGTATGRPYYPADPKVSEIHVLDLACQLSRICRFNGALKPEIPGIYSVAQHLVHCHDVAPPHLQLEALVHDAHETYTQDIVKPFKLMLDDYNEFEELNERVMRKFFGLPRKMSPEVKEIDKRMFVTERRDLCSPGRDGLDWGPLENPFPFTITAWTPMRARNAWLDRLNRHWRG